MQRVPSPTTTLPSITQTQRREHRASSQRFVFAALHETYQHNNFGLWLLGIYQAHDSLDSACDFFGCVFVIICSNPNNNDLRGEEMFATFSEQVVRLLLTLITLYKHQL